MDILKKFKRKSNSVDDLMQRIMEVHGKLIQLENNGALSTKSQKCRTCDYSSPCLFAHNGKIYYCCEKEEDRVCADYKPRAPHENEGKES